jgi:hypothetical protein
MLARAVQSNHASPPKGGTIGEFLEQIVFVAHGSPFLQRLFQLVFYFSPLGRVCPIQLFDE